MSYIIFASGGNDSVALVQYAHEKKAEGCFRRILQYGLGKPGLGRADGAF